MECGDLSPLSTARPVAPPASGAAIVGEPPPAGNPPPASEDAAAFLADAPQAAAHVRSCGPAGRPVESGDKSPHSITSLSSPHFPRHVP
jgi:hypothetical protein